MNPAIQAWLATARERWAKLESRERLALKALAIVLAALTFYFALLAPISRSLNRLRTEVPQERLQLGRMREQAAQVTQMKRTAPPVKALADLLKVVEQSATLHGLRDTFTALEPEGANGVRIQVEGASFNSLLAWLADVQKQGALRTELAAFDAHATAGSVNARLTLRAGAQ